MNRDALSKVLARCNCRVIGSEYAGNDGHRLALAVLAQAFDNSESAVLCEPSLSRKTRQPPDLVLIDPEVGVHVLEVKGMTLDGIDGIEAGGQILFRYGTLTKARNPIAQVRDAMFDIKNATERVIDGPLQLRFEYWVIFPFIERAAWFGRFGKNAYCPPEFLFASDLQPTGLARKFGAADRLGANTPIKLGPLNQLQGVWEAFGDNSVLYASPPDRQPRRTQEGTLGELFDDSAEGPKSLSKDQQRLSEMDWDEGPRVVRGVAGSGKTIVLANNLARRLERNVKAAADNLFTPTQSGPRLLAVCFNRTLAPMIRKKIAIAYLQRTGLELPEDSVQVCYFNALMWNMSRSGLWRYLKTEDEPDAGCRAKHYLADIEAAKKSRAAFLAAVAFDAIYVDEGQDFLEDEFRLLKELCHPGPGGEPNLYVFYDDAQNLYGHARPNWQSLGLNVRGGRSFVMTDCFRNTHPIVESTLNVLYGTCAPTARVAPTKEFGDLATLEEKGLIENDNGFWRVKFAKRKGQMPTLTIAAGLRQEAELIVSRLRWLIEEQQVRPEDILVLTYGGQRARSLANSIRSQTIQGVSAVYSTGDDKEKDKTLNQTGRITVSTVASAKGYDAYCVLLASANDFPVDVRGRATFYVGCTRAIEYLEVFAHVKKDLVVELEKALQKLQAG